MRLEGLAVVFNRPVVLFEVDGIQYKEVIAPTALDNADLTDVVLRYNHQGAFIVLARTRNRSLQMEKRQEGLYMAATLQSDIQAHRDAYAAVKAGLVDKMSFAFAVADGGDSYVDRLRTVSAIRKLFDVSIVDQAAYDSTWVEARNKFDAADRSGTLELQRQAMDLQINLIKDVWIWVNSTT